MEENRFSNFGRSAIHATAADEGARQIRGEGTTRLATVAVGTRSLLVPEMDADFRPNAGVREVTVSYDAIAPLSGLMMTARTLMIVDLPAPFGRQRSRSSRARSRGSHCPAHARTNRFDMPVSIQQITGLAVCIGRSLVEGGGQRWLPAIRPLILTPAFSAASRNGFPVSGGIFC